jgi:hypothetical protein
VSGKRRTPQSPITKADLDAMMAVFECGFAVKYLGPAAPPDLRERAEKLIELASPQHQRIWRFILNRMTRRRKLDG